MSDPFGTLIFTQTYLDDKAHTVTIEQADPHILIADQLLQKASDNPGWNYIRLERGSGGTCEHRLCHPTDCWTDWLLHVDIPGRHLVYRIGKYRLNENLWEASWPD